MTLPFYDPTLSYQENYDLGPFGGILEDPTAEESAALALSEERWTSVAGLRVRRPLGIPAGPLLNSKYTGAAFKWGFDLLHYKTVRSRRWPAHPAPNVLRVDSGEIPPEDLGAVPLKARPFTRGEAVDAAGLSITNSFGMPAQEPEVWQADMERAVRAAGPGQALIASVYGTDDPDAGPGAYVADFARTAAMCRETGAHAIEVNLSCPNLGGHGLLCHDAASAGEVCRQAREAVGSDAILVAKVGSYPVGAAGDQTLARVIEATAPYLQGYGVINAVPVPVVSGEGSAALRGAGRDLAGVCGAALRPTGLAMVRRVAAVRERSGFDFAIIGVGGMGSPADYLAYLDAGADAVQGATGPMWNYRLAVEIAAALRLQPAHSR
jgi:dihydroorotate dehydrogenase